LQFELRLHRIVSQPFFLTDLVDCSHSFYATNIPGRQLTGYFIDFYKVSKKRAVCLKPEKGGTNFNFSKRMSVLMLRSRSVNSFIQGGSAAQA
jgi:hypothetical protein